VLTVIDAPGLGEDVARDPDYLRMYQENLGRCDVVLWVMSARNRAVALDQMYLRELSCFHDRLVLGINQADLVEPLDWVEQYNIPSAQQEHNLSAITADRADRIGAVVGRVLPVVAYSAHRGYQLEELFTTVLKACPEGRRWIYAGLKNFSYRDFVPAESGGQTAAKVAGAFGRLINKK
jgi:hypothetical protein